MADPMREAFEPWVTARAKASSAIVASQDGSYPPDVQEVWDVWQTAWKAASTSPAAMPDGKPLPQVSRDDLANLIVRAACETEPADPDDPETIKIRTHDLKWAALAAFELADLSPAIPQEAKPVAVIRFDRSTPGNENEMPRVVSCIRLPDGEYPVYAAPPAAIAQEPDDADLEQILKERDDAEDMADQLAAQIAAITGVDIGEHSSANDPWREAMLAADEWIARAIRKLLNGKPQDDVVWPVPPPRKGQSPVLFDDGYEEGWAKCLDTLRKAAGSDGLKPLDLKLCESQKLVMQPGRIYRFVDDPTCAECRRIAALTDAPPGPLPVGGQDATAAQSLSDAVATERERCASIADKREARCGRQSERAVARLIAAAIRRAPGAEAPL